MSMICPPPQEVSLLSIFPPSLVDFSIALGGFTTKFGELSDEFTGTSAAVENLPATVHRVSIKFDCLDAIVDSLHQKLIVLPEW